MEHEMSVAFIGSSGGISGYLPNSVGIYDALRAGHRALHFLEDAISIKEPVNMDQFATANPGEGTRTFSLAIHCYGRMQVNFIRDFQGAPMFYWRDSTGYLDWRGYPTFQGEKHRWVNEVYPCVEGYGIDGSYIEGLAVNAPGDGFSLGGPQGGLGQVSGSMLRLGALNGNRNGVAIVNGVHLVIEGPDPFIERNGRDKQEIRTGVYFEGPHKDHPSYKTRGLSVIRNTHHELSGKDGNWGIIVHQARDVVIEDPYLYLSDIWLTSSTRECSIIRPQLWESEVVDHGYGNKIIDPISIS